MTRVVQRRKASYKTQPEKRPDAIVGLCGWCITRTHARCMGMRSDHLTCTCERCYGPSTTTKKETSNVG